MANAAILVLNSCRRVARAACLAALPSQPSLASSAWPVRNPSISAYTPIRAGSPAGALAPSLRRPADVARHLQQDARHVLAFTLPRHDRGSLKCLSHRVISTLVSGRVAAELVLGSDPHLC